MTPKIAEIIKNALQIKDLGYGSAIGEAFTTPYNKIAKPLVEPSYKAVQGEMATQRASRILNTASRITKKGGAVSRAAESASEKAGRKSFDTEQPRKQSS